MQKDTLSLRPAVESDFGAITDLALQAFGPQEGPEIVQLLTDLSHDSSARPSLSLLALQENRLVGHAFFSAARLVSAGLEPGAALLAPLAVSPDWQSQGIGGLLIKEGCKRLSRAGVALLFVLGHPGYYPRYGFVEAGRLGYAAPHPIAPEHAAAWMVRRLQPHLPHCHEALQLHCAQSISAPHYWQPPPEQTDDDAP